MFENAVQFSVVASLIFSTMFLVYVVTIIIPFVRYKPSPSGDPSEFEWHLFVPCRDEEAVIGGTIDYLRATFRHAHVWVIDDHSEDATAALTLQRASTDALVHLIQRRLPFARTGKGDALNTAYFQLNSELGAHVRRSQIVVAVIDADGRPSANMLAAAAAADAFGDSRVAGVQIEVRMVNREERRPLPQRGRVHNWLARQLIRMQDLEFRAPIAAIQLTRKYSRTVNLGGNGQLTRLSALDSINTRFGAPWHGSLLEDYELGLHLLLSGWRNVYTVSAWVDQEALPDVRRFLKQRTRWAQGTMQCIKYLLPVWRSRRISNLGALEVSYFMVQPWLQLVGTFCYTLPMVVAVYSFATHPGWLSEFLSSGGWTLLAAYLIVGLGEFAIWGLLYRYRCERKARWLTALGWGLGYVVYVISVYVVVWRAFARIITRRDGWAKTRRNAEDLRVGPVAREA